MIISSSHLFRTIAIGVSLGLLILFILPSESFKETNVRSDLITEPKTSQKTLSDPTEIPPRELNTDFSQVRK